MHAHMWGHCIQAETAVDRTLDESLEQQQRNEALTAPQQQQQQHHNAAAAAAVNANNNNSGGALHMPKHYSPEHAAVVDPAAAVDRGDAPQLNVQKNSSSKQQQQQQQQAAALKCPITERVENWSAPADADIRKRYQWEDALKASLNKVRNTAILYLVSFVHYC
jgi:hypothetical protein